MSSSFDIHPGFDEADRNTVGQLYWQAFRGKLGRVFGPDPKGLAFFTRILDPDFALSAYGTDGELLGVAGFKTDKGALTHGEFADMRAIYGLWGSLWRLLPIVFLERSLAPQILLMDGIFVAEAARGRGIGAALLDEVCEEAKKRDCTSVRLDVIDTNPRARALYEKKGFQAGERHNLGLLKMLFGFSYTTTMIRPI